MILDFELSAKFGNHIIVEVRPIFGDDPLGDTIAVNEVMFDESGYHVFRD